MKHVPFWKEKQSEGRISVFEHYLSRLVRKGPKGRHCLLRFESDTEQSFPVGRSWLEAECCMPVLPTLLQMLSAPAVGYHCQRCTSHRHEADRRSHCKCYGLQKMAVLILLKNTQLRTGKLIFSLQRISHGETFSPLDMTSRLESF